MLLIESFIQLLLEASPWLLMGLLIAGLMKAWLPSKILAKHLGSGNKAIVKAVLNRYLSGIALCAIAFGFLLDWGLTFFTIVLGVQMSHSHEILPMWLSVLCSAVLFISAIRPLRQLYINN